MRYSIWHAGFLVKITENEKKPLFFLRSARGKKMHSEKITWHTSGLPLPADQATRPLIFALRPLAVRLSLAVVALIMPLYPLLYNHADLASLLSLALSHRTPYSCFVPSAERMHTNKV